MARVLEDRRYVARTEALAEFEFDPFDDIVADDNGAWRWNSAKSAMHDYLRDYFVSRREDGVGASISLN